MFWYLEVLRNYAVFSGRARRMEYWMFVLFNILIALALTVIETAVGGPGILSVLYSLAVLVPSIAVSVRRLHDTGRSGLWLLAVLIPSIVVSVRRIHDTGRSGLWLIAGMIATVGGIVLLVFMIQDGQVGENRFGPDPKAPVL